MKVGVVSVKLLQPFPEAELVEALRGTKAVTVLERSDDTALTRLVTQALFKAHANAERRPQHPGIPALGDRPAPHDGDLRARRSRRPAAAHHRSVPAHGRRQGRAADLPGLAVLQPRTRHRPSPSCRTRLRAAYPETELMALETKPNPRSSRRRRCGSVSTPSAATARSPPASCSRTSSPGVLGMHSKSAPKYGSEKSGAATNYYITLSPEPVLLTNAELEDVEVVISPDHKAFVHTNPLKGLVAGGTFILQSDLAAGGRLACASRRTPARPSANGASASS